MKQTIIRFKLLVVVSFLTTGHLFAQEKLVKVSQTINVNKDATIDLNTSYTNIIFDTWNRDAVDIEAYIEGEGISKENLEKHLKSWEIDIDGTSNNITINTAKKDYHVWEYCDNDDEGLVTIVLKELKYELADLPDVIASALHLDVELPDLPEMQELPELPELPEGINEFNFDYEAYQKDGEEYLKAYTQKFESTFGKAYSKKMEAWGKRFEQEWEEKYGMQMEAWGKRIAKQLESELERQNAYKKRVEVITKLSNEKKIQLEKIYKERKQLADERRVVIKKAVKNDSKSKIKKTIRIKIPKSAKIKVNVRHGELEFASNIDNLKADLSHTKFIANSINGRSTSVNASYSPIRVNHWNLGELNLKYVKDAELNNVKNIVLTSNSSNITINNLCGSSIIDSNIGDLKILKIDDDFTNLNIIIQNSDAVITIPKSTCNIQYKGYHSRFTHPKKDEKEDHILSFSNKVLNSNKTIVLNAKYSNIIMKY